jgi:hypothetical protein
MKRKTNGGSTQNKTNPSERSIPREFFQSTHEQTFTNWKSVSAEQSEAETHRMVQAAGQKQVTAITMQKSSLNAIFENPKKGKLPFPI